MQLPPRHDVVANLREQTPDVNRIGAGKKNALGSGIGADFFIGENGFHAGLRIVEITFDGAGVHVPALATNHLATLDFGRSRFREKHEHFRSRDIRETAHRRRAGVSARRREDCGFFQPRLLCGVLQERRQNRQRNVLKRGGRSLRQIHENDVVANRIKRHGNGGICEARHGAFDGGVAHVFGNIVKKQREEFAHRSRVIAIGFEPVRERTFRRDFGGNVKPAVGRNTV